MSADPEYVRGLLESEVVPSKQYLDRLLHPIAGDPCSHARPFCVGWMVGFGNYHQLCDETVYVGVAYYDTFIGAVPNFGETAEQFDILSLACILLAAKFREARQLEDKQGPYGTTFLELDISAMEARVMTALKYNLDPVTPFSFLDYFLQQMSQRSLLDKAKDVVMDCMKDMHLLPFQPSCVAAVAVLTTCTDEGLTWDFIDAKLRKLMHCRIDTDPVLACYEKMLELLD